MRGLRLAVVLFAFLGSVRAQATAQEIPEEARRAIAMNLQGPFVLLRDAMRDELKLSDEQKEKLDEYFREHLPEFMEFFQSLDGLNHDEREPKLKDFRRKSAEKLNERLKSTLKEDQIKRLHQVELQQEGAFALLHGEPRIAKELKVTDAQRKQFVGVMQELQKKVQPLIKEAESGGNHEEIRSKVMKIKKEQEDKIEALLTDTQRTQWKELLGKPVVFED
jgi:Spy/CpxP family protein refolding chaperone